MFKPISLATCAVAALLAGAPASAVTITFGELPTQPVDGLTFLNVTFDFKVLGVDSTDANFASGGPGTTTFVQDPSLEGSAAGVLTLDFGTPVSSFGFGVALSSGLALTPGVTVALFDSSLAPLGVVAVDTFPLITFTEAYFSYAGIAVGRAVLDFEDSAGRFALDNLEYEAVPEPASVLMIGAGLLGMGARRLRRRR